MNDMIYVAIIAVMFLIFVILHVKQNKKIARLMKRYEKFMKGKNAEKYLEEQKSAYKKITSFLILSG